VKRSSDTTYSTEDRIKALEALGKLGPKVKDAAGRAVAQCMLDRNKRVGLKALDALEKIDPAIAKECNAIVVIDNEHCLTSIQALGRLGKDARSATPILMHVAATLLEPHGVGLRVSKPVDLAAAAIQALVAIAPEEKGLARRFLTWMEAPDEGVRLTIVIGLPRLEQLGKEDKQHAISGLLKQLKVAPWEKVRTAAADALGEFGPEAKAAVEALENAKGDRNEGVRQSARRALSRIRGDQ
jgi:HEAT repeat protein